MSMRMKLPCVAACSTSAATFRCASSSSNARPRCVSLSATFVRRRSAAIRSSSSRYAATTAAVSASVVTPSPRSVVFVSKPLSFRPRRTGTAASRPSPATKRDAPSRKPYRCTNRPMRRAVGGGEDRATEDAQPHSSTIRSTSARSASVRPRSGARTSGSTGTPRSPSTVFAAAWNGSRWSDARNAVAFSCASVVRSRTSGTTASGKHDARPETAPAAPAASRARAAPQPR